MLRRSALLTGGLLLVLATGPAGAGAAGGPTLGPADGVQARATGKTVEIRFTPEAAARAGVAGRDVDVSCATRPSPGLLLGAGGGRRQSGGIARVSPDGTTIRVELEVGPWDTCRVQREDAGLGDQPVARAALTPRGAAWLDDLAVAGPVEDLRFTSFTTPPAPTDAVVGAHGGAVVALDGPDAAPPAGSVGYWSDGATQATIAATSPSGRRLFAQDLGGELVRSNLGEFEGEYVPSDPSRSIDASYPDVPDRSVHHPPATAVNVAGIHVGARVVLRFIGPAPRGVLRSLAGHRVTVRCVRRPDSSTAGPLRLFADAALRVPRHAKALRAAIPAGFDLCAVVDDQRLFAIAALSPAARVLQSRIAAVERLLAAIARGLAPAGATAYPGPQAAAARGHGLLALGTEDGAVPGGRVGVWTDGARRAVAVTTSRSGARLVLGDDGDGIRRSNMDIDLGLAFVLDPVAVATSGPS